MSEWLRIDPAKFSRPRRERIHGAEVEVLSSPYDIPSAVRGGVDRNSNRYVLEFKYIGGDEPLEVNQITPDLTVALGRNSRRLYKLDIAMEPSGRDETVDELMQLLDQVIKDLGTKLSGEEQSDNYDVARLVIKDRAEKLVAAR